MPKIGYKQTDEHKQKIRDATKGRSFSEYHIQKLKESAQKRAERNRKYEKFYLKNQKVEEISKS